MEKRDGDEEVEKRDGEEKRWGEEMGRRDGEKRWREAMKGEER